MAPAMVCLLAIACGGDSAGPATPSPLTETLELRRQTGHFRIFAGLASDATVALTCRDAARGTLHSAHRTRQQALRHAAPH